MIDASESHSTRPYLIRALYEWCNDSGFTPYVAVLVDETVRVPNEYVKDGEIVLNISFDATSALKLGNEFIEFKGRFGGVARDILVPVGRVLAIYARENGQGMAFPMLASSASPAVEHALDEDNATPAVTLTSVSSSPAKDDTGPDKPRSGGGGRPSLTRVK
jgi:stringent starvation protein B